MEMMGSFNVFGFTERHRRFWVAKNQQWVRIDETNPAVCFFVPNENFFFGVNYSCAFRLKFYWNYLKVAPHVSLIEIWFYFQSLLYPTIPTNFSIRWHDGTVVEHMMGMHPRMSSIGQDEAKLWPFKVRGATNGLFRPYGKWKNEKRWRVIVLTSSNWCLIRRKDEWTESETPSAAVERPQELIFQ